MKRWRKQIIVILVGLFAIGISYALCIPCQFFGWMPMPSVSELLANTSPKPVQLAEVSTFGDLRQKHICVHIRKTAFVKKSNHPSGMMFDLPNQIGDIERSFNKSFQFFIDEWRKPVTYVDLSDVGPFIRCVDITGESSAKHIAHIEYNNVDGSAFSYTWVFEVKEDGVVPEVTATPP